MSLTRTSRKSRKPAETTLTKQFVEEEEIPQEKITKKSFNSTDKTTTVTTNSNTKKSEKEPVKMTLAELKNLKNLRKRQEVILLNIENNNIKEHVSKLLAKFDAPKCTNCPNRRADRVCINKACGVDKYMQIICGKCHLNDHQSSITKPEIDVEEFFIKLATFLNESKFTDQKKQQQQPRIDLDSLETIFDDLDLFRQKLASLRSQIENDIESYTSPMEMQSLLQNSITKALSLCEYDNIQEQLLNVKKSVLFNKNKFYWNDAGEKNKSYQKLFKNLDETANQTKSKISKSFIGNMEINLDQLSFKQAKTNLQSLRNVEYKCKDGEILVDSQNPNLTQFYLDYDLKSDKKYKFRFRFASNPAYYTIIGVMEKRQLSQQWLSCVNGQHFYKRFQLDAFEKECSRNLKGGDLNKITMKGDQIEMRVDFENDYADFYDYPEMKSVNASRDNSKFVKGVDYVFTILINSAQSVVLEYFSEISSIEDIV